MGKEKKQFGSQDRNTKNNSSKNIHKDQPLSNQKHKDSYGYNQRNTPNYNRATNDRKNFNALQPTPNNPPKSTKPNTLTMNFPPPSQQSNKNLKLPRQQQIMQALSALGALQGVLNSYEQLEMDKCENVKVLVEQILKKKLPKAV